MAGDGGGVAGVVDADRGILTWKAVTQTLSGIAKSFSREANGKRIDYKKQQWAENRIDHKKQQWDPMLVAASFLFFIFQKKLQKYIFGFMFYSSIPLPPGRGAAGGLPPGRWAVGTYM